MLPLFITFLIFSSFFSTYTKAEEIKTTEIIETNSGPVIGKIVEANNGKEAKAFLGIPYAEPPIKENRWKNAISISPWKDVFNAVEMGPECMQSNKKGDICESCSENCLTLNVWSPKNANKTSKLSVLVFIYGGGFIIGSSNEPIYNGSYIAANKDTIVITFNYRLGALGFLAAKGLTGNYGITDQILALKWVQNNIQNFGGDPEKVTIFGESAGAMSVGLHLLSIPESQTLFNAGIMQSNPAALPYKNKEDAERLGENFTELLKCSDLASMRKISVVDIIKRQRNKKLFKKDIKKGLKVFLVWAPIIDGTIIKNQPVKGRIQKPSIIGINKDEADMFLYGPKQKSIPLWKYKMLVKFLFKDEYTEKVLQAYPADKRRDDHRPIISKIMTDYLFKCANQHLAKNSDQPVYTYQFKKITNSFNISIPACQDKACHTAELPYVFNTPDKIGNFEFFKSEKLLANQMASYWTNFSSNQNPNGEGPELINWPKYTDKHKHYIALNTPLSIDTDPYGGSCKLWDEIGYNLSWQDFADFEKNMD